MKNRRIIIETRKIYILRILAAITIYILQSQSTFAQSSDISGPLNILRANVEALMVTPLNHNGSDRRLALEIVLLTNLKVPASVEAMKMMPTKVQNSILAVCSRMMMPTVENLNTVKGFPQVSGVRITLRSKPATIGPIGAGTYQTLIFPQDRGCKYGW